MWEGTVLFQCMFPVRAESPFSSLGRLSQSLSIIILCPQFFGQEMTSSESTIVLKKKKKKIFSFFTKNLAALQKLIVYLFIYFSV